MKPRSRPLPDLEEVEAFAELLTAKFVASLRAAIRGDSYTKQAADLGIPVGTAKSRLNRARAAFKALKEGRQR